MMGGSRRFPQWLALGAALVVGCGGEDDTDPELADPPPEACVEPERLTDDDRCVGPGVQDNGCPAGTLALDDGSCQPAGIPPHLCGEGFVHDGDVGCDAVLPSEACAVGEMAVPGDTVCRPVMACGAGTWGDIPIDGQTQHVDQSFVGVSNGTIAAPWTTISDAIAAAPDGGMVAVAAGSYLEDLTIVNKHVRLYGVCPAQVEVVGAGGARVIDIRGGGDTELRGIAVRGGGIGISVRGATNVIIDRVWVRDSDDHGIHIDNVFGATSAVVRASLVERHLNGAIFVFGSDASLEAVAVRDGHGGNARGINVDTDPTGIGARVSVSGSLIERHQLVGVFVSGSELTFERNVVRDMLTDAPRGGGRGMAIQYDSLTGGIAVATVRSSVLERNTEIALHASGSELTVEGTVVRDTAVNGDGVGGRGINIQARPAPAAPSLAWVIASLLQGNREIALNAAGADITIEATVVRDTSLDDLGALGRGISIQHDYFAGLPSTGVVRSSVVERSHEFGIGVVNSVVSIDGTCIQSTEPNDAEGFGDGLVASFEDTLTSVDVTASRIGSSSRAGIAAFGGAVSLAGTANFCAAFSLNGEQNFGQEFTFENLGGNGCGCPDAVGLCKAESAGLQPPAPAMAVP
jgi:hypothetical protein